MMMSEGKGWKEGWMGEERERQRLRAKGETAYHEVFHKHRVPFNKCGLSLSYVQVFFWTPEQERQSPYCHGMLILDHHCPMETD